MQTQEPGAHVFKIYLALADSDSPPRPIGTIRADTQALALDKAAQYHERPSHDLLAEQENMYTWTALDPTLLEIYQQATSELAPLGSLEGRYYCRRLNLYATEDNVNRVAALERVLLALEEAQNKTHALTMLKTHVPDFVDATTQDRYIELISNAGDQDENEQAVKCAVEQLPHDMPYCEVTQASLYKKTELFGNRPELTVQGVRWYVEVDIRNLNNEETATVLYRVWRSGQGLKAIRVTVV